MLAATVARFCVVADEGTSGTDEAPLLLFSAKRFTVVEYVSVAATTASCDCGDERASGGRIIIFGGEVITTDDTLVSLGTAEVKLLLSRFEIRAVAGNRGKCGAD